MQKQVCVDFFSIRFAVNDQFLTPESLIEVEFILFFKYSRSTLFNSQGQLLNLQVVFGWIDKNDNVLFHKSRFYGLHDISTYWTYESQQKNTQGCTKNII